ncbi:sensor histidine kinase [Pseudobacteroides cellulosolvens]|uniref:sensor histidine kinase n=1 Tax=Pseudobacteroides cellulosolvens TaxID=35825 RepID=UPI001FA6C53D|nr:GHKL domain-containing protein [Pseudobacteroides cellulosolvens]
MKIIRVNGILFFSYFLLLMIIIYILITSITKEMDLKNKQIQFESLQEYTCSLEKLYTDMRAFRHDYINILSSMIGYIESKDIESLEKYFNEKIFPLSKGMASNNFKLGLLSNIKITEIKGIFSSKLIRAQELNINVFIDIAEPIEKINMDIIDLSRVIGILLDNAIEAAIKCDEPFMKVAVINKENSVLIVIINSIYEEVPIYKIYEKGFSTKGVNRGLGLYNLKQITGKCDNVSLDTIIENGEFKQLVEIANR